jgi:hypothetical protein
MGFGLVIVTRGRLRERQRRIEQLDVVRDRDPPPRGFTRLEGVYLHSFFRVAVHYGKEVHLRPLQQIVVVTLQKSLYFL